ncbi:MAG TPA: chemotaxis protein CheW [Pyrinomonadaceae bacterium]|jgi:chemotaxis signal transduction protein
MREKEQQSGIEPSARREGARDASAYVLSEERELLLMRAGGRLFAVFAEEVDCMGEGLKPAALPHAPACILGVVSLRGRMRTVIDPLLLLLADDAKADDQANAPAPSQPHADSDSQHTDDLHGFAPTTTTTRSIPLVVALRGDEQLALAVESVERLTGVSPEAFEQIPESAAPAAAAPTPFRSILPHGDARVLVLHPSRLFEAAMRGTERRRPR